MSTEVLMQNISSCGLMPQKKVKPQRLHLFEL